MRIVQHDETDKFRIFRRQISDEGNDIFAVFVAAFGIDFLRRAGFARDGETGNSGRCGGAAIAHDAAQGIADLRRGLAAKLPGAKQPAKKSLTVLPSAVGDRFHDARRDQFAAIRDRRHRHRHLQRSHADLVAHRDAGDGNLAPGLRRTDHAADFARQFDRRCDRQSQNGGCIRKIFARPR